MIGCKKFLMKSVIFRHKLRLQRIMNQIKLMYKKRKKLKNKLKKTIMIHKIFKKNKIKQGVNKKQICKR